MVILMMYDITTTLSHPNKLRGRVGRRCQIKVLVKKERVQIPLSASILRQLLVLLGWIMHCTSCLAQAQNLLQKKLWILRPLILSKHNKAFILKFWGTLHEPFCSIQLEYFIKGRLLS